MKPYFCGQQFFGAKTIVIDRHVYNPDTDDFTIIVGDTSYSEKEFAKEVKGLRNNFYSGYIPDEDTMAGFIGFIAGTAKNAENDGKSLSEAVEETGNVLGNIGLIVGNGEAMFPTGTIVKFKNIVTAVYDGWDVINGTGR